MCIAHLGLLTSKIGQSLEAIKLLAVAKELFLLLNHRKAVAYCMWSMGDVYTNLGRFTTAEDLLEDAVKRAQCARDCGTEAQFGLLLVHVWTFRGKSAALELVVIGQKYFQHVGDKFMVSQAIDAWGTWS